ncbi:hypothetical protein ALC56_04725 [Trachymyrmex septentrionalis]|uniref:Uncharacterized protein n=1 Tax=Trachymyrmex septentrionalis TaxID=34720 RepID=A0A195FLG8_9HYME|nr:hypothetical protein ALC56_04725 [Trachymyrmex septentrionalis]
MVLTTSSTRCLIDSHAECFQQWTRKRVEERRVNRRRRRVYVNYEIGPVVTQTPPFKRLAVVAVTVELLLRVPKNLSNSTVHDHLKRV